MKKLLLTAALAAALSGCHVNDADVVSKNLSQAADNFQISRRIVFINTYTNDFVLEVRGKCSLDNNSTESKLAIVCKLDNGEYRKHYLGRGDGLSYFIEQLDSKTVSAARYAVTFKPSAILPEIEIR